MEQEKKPVENVNPEVYRTSKGWRIFLIILIPPFVCFITWLMMIFPFIGNNIDNMGLKIFFFLLGLVSNVFLVYALFQIMKYKVEVFQDRIVETDVFKKKEMLLADIRGFRILQTKNINYVQFIPVDPSAKKNKIALMINNVKGFEQWLNKTLKNLDAEDYENEMQSILSNEELGITEEQRAYTLQRAKRLTNILNISAIAAFFWITYKPQPYSIAVWTIIVFPYLALLSTRAFPGLIKFDGPKKGAYPTIAIPLLMPPIALSLRAFFDWKILAWQNFWLPFSFLSLLLFVATLFFLEDVRKKIGQLVSLFIFCAAYGYSVTLCLNGILDYSPSTQYEAIVLDKHMSSGRSTSYYLKLSTWGPRGEVEDVTVSKRLYEIVRLSDTVGVNVKEGKFKIPWYFVRRLK